MNKLRLSSIGLCCSCLLGCNHPVLRGGPGVPDDGGVAQPDATMVCAPSEPPSCDANNDVQVCRADGSGYEITPCAGGCSNGQCNCSLGQRRCNGMTAQVCVAGGGWMDDAACLAQCHDGVCDDIRCAGEATGAGEFSLPNDAWPRFRHDNRNSGWNPVPVADMPKRKWKSGPYGTNYLNTQYGGMASGPVVNQANVVFVGAGDGDGKNGALYSLDSTGKQLWVFMGNRGYGYTTPAVRTDGTSYFSSQDGNAYAVDSTGMLAWKFPFGMQDDCSPIVTSAGNVIYGSDTNQLFALDFNGHSLWESDPTAGPGEVDSALAESCDGVVLAGGRNGWAALDAKSGMTTWKIAATGQYGALMSSPLVDFDGNMYGVDSGGIAIAIDKTGKTLWAKQVGPAGAGTSMAKIGTLLLVVLNDGMLHALDSTSGTSMWSANVHQQPETFKHGGPVVDGRQRIYFSSNDGNLYCFDTKGNALWQQPTSGVVATGASSFGEMAIANDGTLYVPGNDGMLHAFQ